MVSVDHSDARGVRVIVRAFRQANGPGFPAQLEVEEYTVLGADGATQASR